MEIVVRWSSTAGSAEIARRTASQPFSEIATGPILPNARSAAVCGRTFEIDRSQRRLWVALQQRAVDREGERGKVDRHGDLGARETAQSVPPH